MCRGVMRRIEDELNDSLAIAQIDKDESAMIAARVDPSEQSDLAARIGTPQCAAVVSALPWRQRRISFFSHQILSLEGYPPPRLREIVPGSAPIRLSRGADWL